MAGQQILHIGVDFQVSIQYTTSMSELEDYSSPSKDDTHFNRLAT